MLILSFFIEEKLLKSESQWRWYIFLAGKQMLHKCYLWQSLNHKEEIFYFRKEGKMISISFVHCLARLSLNVKFIVSKFHVMWSLGWVKCDTSVFQGVVLSGVTSLGLWWGPSFHPGAVWLISKAPAFLAMSGVNGRPVAFDQSSWHLANHCSHITGQEVERFPSICDPQMYAIYMQQHMKVKE